MKAKELPIYESLVAAFPKMEGTGPVATLVGGKVKHNLEGPDPDYKNTCAIRISRALNYAGAPIPSPKFLTGIRVNSGDDKMWYVYSVRDLHKYLVMAYGTPHVTREASTVGGVKPEEFKGETGIIEFENFHIDLWNGTTCEKSCYWGAVNRVYLWRAESKSKTTSALESGPTLLDAVRGAAGAALGAAVLGSPPGTGTP